MRQFALAQDTTVGSVIERAFRLLLAEEKQRKKRGGFEFPIMDVGGFQPGIDPTSNASLFAAIEDDELLT